MLLAKVQPSVIIIVQAQNGKERKPLAWIVYILRCGDGTLYTGITDDLPRRLEAHRAGRGAKYTRGRGPLELVYAEAQPDRAAASRREWSVKQLTRAEKEALAAAWNRAVPDQ